MKAKGFFIAAGLLTTAFALAAAVEWNGYHMFDQPNGGNILCTLDPTCRRMTEGEVALIREYFGDQVDTKTIKIFSRGHFRLPLENMAPNGNIYFSSQIAGMEDFSKLGTGHKSMLIHEATHVWQLKKGMNVRREAAKQFFWSGGNYASVYKYDIKAHEDFYRFNLEQQAEMMENYYLSREELRLHIFGLLAHDMDMSLQDMQSRIRNSCETFVPLEDKILQEFPVTPMEACDFARVKLPKPGKRQRFRPS